MQNNFSKILLRYLIFVGIPFLVAPKIEKFLLNRLDSKTKKKLHEKYKRFPQFANISDETTESIDIRGGAAAELFWLWFIEVFIVDFGPKAILASTIGSSIWSETADTAAGVIMKYAATIVSAPGSKFKNLYKKLRKIDPKHTQEIQEILLDKNLSEQDKLQLVMIKVEQTVKTLKGPKRKKFIAFVIALLFFFFGGKLGNGIVGFSGVMEYLRRLLGSDLDVDLQGALIEVYREYNAPLPEEFVNIIDNIS